VRKTSLVLKFSSTSTSEKLPAPVHPLSNLAAQPKTGQVAQLSQKDRAAGWVSFDQKWKTRTERQYFADITDLSFSSKVRFYTENGRFAFSSSFGAQRQRTMIIIL